MLVGAFEPKSPDYDKPAIMKAMIGLFLHNLSTEKVQVHGVAALGDLTDFQVKHQTYWTLDDLKRSAAMMNVCI